MSYPYGGINAVSLGTGAGSTLQGATAIAIGYQAGAVSQPASSIIINASGTALSGVAPNALYMDPIRNMAASTLMMYDTVNKEVVYSSTLNNTLTVNNLVSLSTLSASTVSFSTLSVNVANVSTSNVQFINFSTLLGNTGFITSTFTVSTLIAANISVSTLNLSLFSTLTGSSITTSTLALSTMSGNTGFFTSTLTVSTLIAANISVSTLNLSLFSTLTGSSITTSTLALSTFNGNTGFIASTLTVSTLIAANINVSSLALNQFSTLTGSSLIASTIAVSTITANTGFFNSTLIVSTLYASSIIVPSLVLNQFSTLTGSSLIASTIATSTISMNTGFAFSTFTVSTLIAANINVSSLALNQFSTLTGSSLIASTVFASTITTSTLFGQFINYSTLTGSTMNGNVTYSNLLLFSSISSINGSSFGNTGPTGPIGQASQISFFAPGSQSIGPSTAMGVVTLTTLDSTQTTGITGFTFSGITSLFTNTTIQPIPVAASYALALNTTAGGYSAVGLTVLGVTTYFGGMYNASNGVSNSVSVLVPAGGSIGLYYMDNIAVTVQTATRFTVTSNQVGQQGATGVTGPTGPVGQVSQLAYGSTGINQTIVPTGTLSTLVQWPSAAQDAGQSIGMAGLAYNFSGSPTGTFTNITTITLPISVEYTLNLSTTAGGYSAIGINGPFNIFGGNYNDNNGFSNTATILVAPGSYFGVYYMDNTSVAVQANSRISCTLLTAGGQGPTGVTGPIGAAAQASYLLAGNQSITAGSYQVVQFVTLDVTQSQNSINLGVNAGVFTNNSSATLPILVEYTLNLSTTSGGYSGVALNANTTSMFGGMFNDTNGLSNSCLVLVTPGSTLAVYYSDNSATVIQQAISRITFSVVGAGVQGATGITGPALWSATGSIAPYGVPITYAQGFVGVGVGPTGASFLQTNSGGSTAGTGSSVPQYTLDIIGSERVNGARLFGDGSAQVSAADALDYTTFGQNWTTVSLPVGSWQAVAVSASGQYQTAAGSSGLMYYSVNYGQSWTASTGINAGANLNSISISASGQYQLVTSFGTYGIYYSNNYGVSWIQSNASTVQWTQVCISASGQYATASNTTTGTAYSTNYGVTWTASTAVAGNYQAIVCSSSGQYQVTAVASGIIYYSSNYGQSWIASNISNSGGSVYGAMSGSGQYATIVTNGSGAFITSNYGQTWTQITSVIGSLNLRGVSVSASGQYQVATAYGTGVYYSMNYGVTWVQGLASGANWFEAGISANGQYSLACANGGVVYQSVTRSPTQYTNTIQTATLGYTDNSVAITAGATLDYITFGQNWTQLPTSTFSISSNYQAAAISATGQYQTIVGYSAGIFISSNYGQTWAFATYSGSLPLMVAMSASGQYQVVTTNSNAIFISSNYGQTFTSAYSVTAPRLVCMSTSGQYATVVCSGLSSSYIYSSSNYGATWTQTSAISSWYTGVCCSASGQYQTAASGTANNGNGLVYLSTNYGQTWTQSSLSSSTWYKVCCSASGQYQSITNDSTSSPGGLYYSSNYGQTWALAPSTTGTPVQSITCTASGQYQIAVAWNSPTIFYSTTYGQTWSTTTLTGASNITNVATSSNGQYSIITSNNNIGVQQSITFHPVFNIANSLTVTSNSPQIIMNRTNGSDGFGVSVLNKINGISYSLCGGGWVPAQAANTYGYWFADGATSSGTFPSNANPKDAMLYCDRINGLQVFNLAGAGNRSVYSNASGYLTNTASDSRLKMNITPIDSMLFKVVQLNPVTYNWSDDDIVSKLPFYNKDKQYGFIAQEIGILFPDFIYPVTFSQDPTNTVYYGFDEIKLFPMIIKAIQEQNIIVQSQQTQLQTLQSHVAALQSDELIVQSTIASLQTQLTTANTTITNQSQTITSLQSQVTTQQIQMDQILQRLAAANIA